MNDLITITGIKAFGYHGVFEHEAVNGQDFFVDVELRVNLDKASASDDLKDTVDYVHIYSIVYREMKQRSKLLETVVQRIIDEILSKHISVQTVQVEVAKINPPIGGDVGYVSVERKAKRTSN